MAHSISALLLAQANRRSCRNKCSQASSGGQRSQCQRFEAHERGG